jgi:type VI protein secretion system component Hcp
MKTVTEQIKQTEKNELHELTDAQLDKVAGGDLQITKTTDKSSSTLYGHCCTGQHIKSGTIT